MACPGSQAHHTRCSLSHGLSASGTGRTRHESADLLSRGRSHHPSQQSSSDPPLNTQRRLPECAAAEAGLIHLGFSGSPAAPQRRQASRPRAQESFENLNRNGVPLMVGQPCVEHPVEDGVVLGRLPFTDQQLEASRLEYLADVVAATLWAASKSSHIVRSCESLR
jgi:hypothetical protein